MANEQILIVEDERDLLENNLEYFDMQGYRTKGAATLEEARSVLRITKVDLILLDLNLPDGSGFDLAGDTPEDTAILYLTGRTADQDVVRGLSRNQGMVDYLKKPFSYAELGARAASLLRMRAADPADKTIVRGPLMLDIAAQQGYLSGKDLMLTQKEFSILRLFLENEGRLLSHEHIYEAVWKQPLKGSGNALWMQISRLKKKLEKCDDQIMIMSVRGEGYRLEILV